MSESSREAKHTPGPWTALQRGGVLAADGLLVAQCVQPYARVTSTGIEADREVAQGPQANARLVAAAPDMLAALRLALTPVLAVGSDEAVNALQAAFEKAGVLP